MTEETKLPVKDDETKIETAEATDELQDDDLEQVAGGALYRR